MDTTKLSLSSCKIYIAQVEFIILFAKLFNSWLTEWPCKLKQTYSFFTAGLLRFFMAS